jgi:hypothetical protein
MLKIIAPTDADFKAMFKNLPQGALHDAPAFHRAVFDYLMAHGWACVDEVAVADRGDGRVGRVDIVVNVVDGQMGIELDYKCPRQKSRFKVGRFPLGGFILLRATRGIVRIPPGGAVAGSYERFRAERRI